MARWKGENNAMTAMNHLETDVHLPVCGKAAACLHRLHRRRIKEMETAMHNRLETGMVMPSPRAMEMETGTETGTHNHQAMVTVTAMHNHQETGTETPSPRAMEMETGTRLLPHHQPVVEAAF